MSQCVRGSLVLWLLMMACIGAFLCTTTTASTVLENGKYHAENQHYASLDSPTDGGWRDWLLNEDTQASSSDTGFLFRRITPKSVFVAPSLSVCSEGYRQDGMGRCVKLVKVNQAAQLDFLLQKLNSMYAPSNSKKKNENSGNSGPFHVSLPLGGIDNNSNNNNNNINNKVPNDKDKQSNNKVTMKPTTEQVNNLSLLSSSSSISNSNKDNSSSEINIKKTELFHKIDLPIATTQSSEVTSIQPQQNFNSSNTRKNIETTTNIYNTNIVTLPITFHSPVASPEENQQISIENIFDSTVKREPQNNNHSHNSENEDLSNMNKPFVIVVPNSTYRPFDSTGEDTLSTNKGETVPSAGFDYSTITTNRGIQTATESTIQDTTSFSTTVDNNSDAGETITSTLNDGFTTIFLTKTMKTTEEQTSIISTTETTPFESSKFETLSEDKNTASHLNTHTTISMTIPNTSAEEQENEEIDQEGITEEEDEAVYNEGDDGSKLDIIDEDTPSVFDDDNLNDKNVRQSSGRPSTRIPELSLLPINLSENVRVKCSYSELNYGRINYENPSTNCKPDVTTVRYPAHTTTPKPLQPPYYIRFPVDTGNTGYTKTNSYIRFPEQTSSSSSHGSSMYGTKLWNTNSDISSSSSSSSSSMWYPPSWFPYLPQVHRTWPQNNNNNNNNSNHRNQQLQYHPMSTVYHKQYHQQQLVPQNVPSWINSYSPWMHRD